MDHKEWASQYLGILPLSSEEHIWFWPPMEKGGKDIHIMYICISRCWSEKRCFNTFCCKTCIHHFLHYQSTKSHFWPVSSGISSLVHLWQELRWSCSLPPKLCDQIAEEYGTFYQLQESSTSYLEIKTVVYWWRVQKRWPTVSCICTKLLYMYTLLHSWPRTIAKMFTPGADWSRCRIFNTGAWRLAFSLSTKVTSAILPVCTKVSLVVTPCPVSTQTTT